MLLIIILIIVILLFLMLNSNNRILSHYAVLPNISYIPLMICDNKLCQFTVNNLKEATEKCTENHNICSSFLFDEKTNIMIFTNTGSQTTTSASNTYVRQSLIL